MRVASQTYWWGVLEFLVAMVYHNVRLGLKLATVSGREYLLEFPENVGFLEKYALRKTLYEVPPRR